MRSFLSFFLIFLIFVSYTSSAQDGSTKYALAVEAYQSADFPTAEHYWSELALDGDARAQYALGIMHLKKEAQRSADATAFQYLVEAAKQQHIAAMFNLGVAYWEGRGVLRQPEKAANWWEAAAEKNDAGAQYNLGLAYYIGEGREQSPENAIYWLQQSAENEHPQAKELLNRLQQGDNQLAEQSSTAATPSDELGKANQTEAVPGSASEAAVSAVDNQVSPATRDPIILRAAPGRDAVSLSTIEADTQVQELQSRKGWLQVLVDEAYPVWVHESLVEELGNGQGEIRGSNVNIRPAPSTDNVQSPPLGQLNDGDLIEIIERSEPWIKIMPPRAFPAWVESNTLL